MAEEFQESDVFWPEQSHRREDRRYHSVFQDENVDPAEIVNNSSAVQQNSRQPRKKKIEQRNSSHSVPVNIGFNRLHYSDSNDSDDDLEDAEMVPPHLIVAGRFERRMASSVCTGNGRTLKGRDLSRVRNCVLKMTGFLET